MASKRVTITDLANELGLSICTVSKILNRSFDGVSYSKGTILQVEQCAARLGYRVNFQAQSLRSRKTMLIGFLLPSAQISFFGALTDQLELELRTLGYQMLIVHSRNDPKGEPDLLSSLVARGIDGLIWIPAGNRVKDATLGQGFPAVILDRPGCTRKLPFVATDNQAAGRELARRSHELGHRRVGILTALEGDRSMEERLSGIREVFGRNLRIMDIPNSDMFAKEAVIKLLSGKHRPGVVLALSESLAMGALAGLRELDMKIPDDVSFAAFDDFPLADCWSPRISVVRQDIAALASEAVKMLLQRIESPATRLPDVRVHADLKWRESVVPRRVA